MKSPTKRDAETLRGELFHMVVFAMAWVLIGEYSFHFRDYALAAVLVLAIVVRLSFFSIRLYDLEDSLSPPDAELPHEKKRTRFFTLTFVFEGVAIMITWIVLLNLHHREWVIPCFAAIAGLHFFPLGRIVRQPSYYFLGIWTCLVAIAGYLLLYSGKATDQLTNTLVAYGCAAGASIDGIGIIVRTNTTLKRKPARP
jgi:hypothetical protein